MDRRIFVFVLVALAVVALLALSLIAVVGLRNFNTPGQPSPTPTINVTQAYQTVAARLTQAGSATPAITRTLIPTESGQRTPTATAFPTSSPTLPISVTPPGPPACDRAAAGNPIDVTIPDDSEMRPGENFTKVWSLVNVGACSWTPAYAAVWFSGEMMSAPSEVRLGETVEPGESVEISIEMIAPAKPGTYQSNWKLQNEAGVLFGIGPNGTSPFWVRIIVVDDGAGTPAVTLTPTSVTPSPTLGSTPINTQTPTEAIQASGPVTLAPGNLLDMDTLAVNPGSGADLLYHANDQAMHWLTPQGSALLGVFGTLEPARADCQNANLSAASLPVESLADGTYLCHQTDQGRLGWTRLGSQNPENKALGLNVLTWAGP